jgi:hypothetical protein
MRQDFSLVPWRSTQASAALPDLQVTGWIDRSGDLLEIQYQLVGDLAGLTIAAPVALPSRRFALWEATCLEFFVATLGQPHYWEFNLSPSGDWNVFRLEDYRQGLRNEELVPALPFQVSCQARELTLSLSLSLGGLVDRSEDLEMAMTAVLQDRSGAFSYWAVSHPGPEADFHRRDGFTVQLPAGGKS